MGIFGITVFWNCSYVLFFNFDDLTMFLCHLKNMCTSFLLLLGVFFQFFFDMKYPGFYFEYIFININ